VSDNDYSLGLLKLREIFQDDDFLEKDNYSKSVGPYSAPGTRYLVIAETVGKKVPRTTARTSPPDAAELYYRRYRTYRYTYLVPILSYSSSRDYIPGPIRLANGPG